MALQHDLPKHKNGGYGIVFANPKYEPQKVSKEDAERSRRRRDAENRMYENKINKELEW